MKTILSNFSLIIQYLKKEYPMFKKIKPVYVFVLILLFITIYSSIFYNSSLKQKRIKEINAFLSNDQTVLQNYIINKIKSPFEYDYIVKNNDTIETILKNSVLKEEVDWIVKN